MANIFQKIIVIVCKYESFSYFCTKKLIIMKPTEQTLKQIDRAIRKIADKFPASQEASMLTDIHIHVVQETGEFTAYDDDDREITRCIIEQWIDDKSGDFYEQVANVLRKEFRAQQKVVESMSVLRPYSFVLESDDREEQYELYVVDDDTVIIDSELMEHLDEELDSFFNELMKDTQ